MKLKAAGFSAILLCTYQTTRCHIKGHNFIVAGTTSYQMWLKQTHVKNLYIHQNHTNTTCPSSFGHYINKKTTLQKLHHYSYKETLYYTLQLQLPKKKLRVQWVTAELQANVLSNKQNPYKNIKNKDNTIINIVFQNFLVPSFFT